MSVLASRTRAGSRRLLLSSMVAAISFTGASGALADQGIEVSGGQATVYFDDQGWTGSWNYLCVDNYCVSGALVDGRWQRAVTEQSVELDASYNIKIQIQDNATGQYISQDIPVVASGSGGTTPPENQPPTVSLSAQPASVVVGESVSVTASASDSDGSVDTVALYLTEPGSGESLVSTFSVEPYQWQITPAQAGDYLLRVVASDDDGAIAEDSISVAAVADTGGDENQAPTVSFTSLPSGLKAGDNAAISVVASDADGQIEGVELLYTEPAGSELSAGVLQSAPYQWSIGNLVKGDYALRTVATDDQGATASATAAFFVGDDNTCGEPPVEVDPGAEYGDGFVFGLTNGGVVYHRAMAGHNPGFAILGLQNNAPNLPETGPFDHTEQAGAYYQRYQTELASVDAATTYDLEIRLQGGQFNGGQCIFSTQLKPGEGLSESPCFIAGGDGGDGGPSEPVKVAIGSVVHSPEFGPYLKAGTATAQPGFTLYTFDDDGYLSSACDEDCLKTWPALLVDSPDSFAPVGGVTGEFATIERVRTEVDDCGEPIEIIEYQVTYDGRPLYFYVGDAEASDTSGHGVNNAWWVASVELIPQLPLVDYPAPALKTPILGKKPRLYGFTFDLDGRTITWHPGHNSAMDNGLIAQFSPWGGYGAPRQAKDPNLEFYCSNNQIQFHKADMPGTLAGPYKADIPGACYGEYYYFFRYRKYGEVNLDPDGNWEYSALFVYDEAKPDDRVDPDQRGKTTYHSANWMRHGHPHSRDRTEESIFDALPYNMSPLSGLERYATHFIDEPGNIAIQADASVAPMRIELLERGAGNCQGPQYTVNAYPIPADVWDYGQIMSWEATFPTADNSKYGGDRISSQVYNTMQYTTPGAGFTTSTGDPRLNSSGRAGVRMVHSDGCNPVENDERDAAFTQHLTTVVDPDLVNDFLLGHHLFHGVSDELGAREGSTGFPGSVELADVDGNVIQPEGNASCGDCHVRDGRSPFVANTPKGPLIAPPTYGSGLLSWIEGAEVGLTWDGSVADVRQQTTNALWNDHGLLPEDIGLEEFERVVNYTELLHVPVRKYSSYTDPEVAEGEVAFHNAGCIDCHQPTQKTRSDAPESLRDIYIRPYTDMKLHDIGTGSMYRTPPLWGIGRNIEILNRRGLPTLFMHDGRASSLEEAISLHEEEAIEERTALEQSGDLDKVIKFLNSL
ncbi:di-heme oxidoredictase family protein [Aliagarivorans marinus]|uniref:di-heme oxidoredictase family protein n=1 Tax=Aliagarivorans marinus TaxID=561965 RepID=UPI00041AA55E|nr:di-heme oxidoredictase family protein [Aliagarivorans marinus]